MGLGVLVFVLLAAGMQEHAGSLSGDQGQGVLGQLKTSLMFTQREAGKQLHLYWGTKSHGCCEKTQALNAAFRCFCTSISFIHTHTQKKILITLGNAH